MLPHVVGTSLGTEFVLTESEIDVFVIFDFFYCLSPSKVVIKFNHLISNTSHLGELGEI